MNRYIGSGSLRGLLNQLRWESLTTYSILWKLRVCKSNLRLLLYMHTLLVFWNGWAIDVVQMRFNRTRMSSLDEMRYRRVWMRSRWVGMISRWMWMRSPWVGVRSTEWGWDLLEWGWDLVKLGWDLGERGWDLRKWGRDLVEWGWDLGECEWDLR